MVVVDVFAKVRGRPPAGVSAVILNVTATAPTSTGYISVYPDRTDRPNASVINFTCVGK